MITLRYHMITISAVFLSLGLGIILGGSIGQNWINEKQQTILSGLEQKYDQAMKSNEELQEKIQELSLRIEQANQEFSALVSNNYLTDLQGKKIGLWQQSGLDSQQLRELLESVGLKLELIGDAPPAVPLEHPVLFLGGNLPEWARELKEGSFIQLTGMEASPSKQWELLHRIQHLFKENQHEY